MSKCPQCSRNLSPNAAGGPCPACLLLQGLAAQTVGPRIGEAAAEPPPTALGGDASDGAPERIGPYTLLGVLGEGGMGTVYRAQQSHPIRRTVAVKLIRLGYGSCEVIARFEAERVALSRLDHPHIAKILDAGLSEVGQPYVVMEYVPGVPVTKFADRERLTVRQRLELFIQICDAVAHAHSKALIHRDIKASNVLAFMADGKPTVKVIDFGIAKAVAGDQGFDVTFATARGIVLGTPYAMSPEQAEGSPDIDTRTDVYSLGVLLYELLAGRKPFREEDLASAAHGEVLRIIREVEPPRPSVAVADLGGTAATAADHRGTRVPALTRALRAELEWIPLKAMRKDRARRYASPLLLAEDLKNYLDGRPLMAGPESRIYRLSKFAGRNRGVVLSTAALAVLLAAGLTLYIRGIRNEQRRTAAALAEANTQRVRAEQITGLITKSLVSADPNQSGEQSMLVSQAMDQVTARLDAGELQDQPEVEASIRLIVSQVLDGNARSEEGLRQAERALSLAQRSYSGDNIVVADALADIASCQDSLGRGQDALPNYQAALAMLRRLHDAEGPQLASLLGDMGLCLRGLGRSREALAACQEALGIRQRAAKEDGPELAAALNNVALCLGDLGRADEAMSKREEALTMFQRLFKGDHPAVAEALNNLAASLDALGRSPEALPRYEAALEMKQRLFRGDHPNVALALNNVGYCLGRLGRHAEALVKYRAALEMFQRIFRADHPQVARSLNNVAACLCNLGDNRGALPMYEAALAMNRRLFPGDHPEVAINLSNLAKCYLALGRLDEALTTGNEALRMRRVVLPADHPDLVDSLATVGAIQRTLGHFAEAEGPTREGLVGRERTFGPEDARTCRSAFFLAQILDQLGRTDEGGAIRAKYRLGDPTTHPAARP